MFIFEVTSIIIAILLCILVLISALVTILSLYVFIISIIEKEIDDVIESAKGIFLYGAIVVLFVFANLYLINQKTEISSEIPIASYEGIQYSSIKNDDILCFWQGSDKESSLIKIDAKLCTKHKINNDEKIKVVKTTTHYTAKLKYLSVLCFKEPVHYDIYIPEK